MGTPYEVWSQLYPLLSQVPFLVANTGVVIAMAVELSAAVEHSLGLPKLVLIECYYLSVLQPYD